MIDTFTTVQLNSNMTFKMENGAILKGTTNDPVANSAILLIAGKSNVNVVGGTVMVVTTGNGGPGGSGVMMGIWIDASANVSKP